jgi:phosphoribosylformylglycinamidine synthase I
VAGNAGVVVIMKTKAMVLTGEGINCDFETRDAFELAGATAKRVHVNDVIRELERLEDYQILAFPGGFSYGDDLGSGKAFGNKILHAPGLFEQFRKFIEDGKLIIGICNGFQIIVKTGLLPGFDGNYNEQRFTLFTNASARHEARWVRLKVNTKSNCVFTKGIEKIDLVVRHNEGRFIPESDAVLKRLWDNNHVVLQYADPSYKPSMEFPYNPNGSVDAIAGVCDETGRVFGLMPHPEAFLDFTNHPHWPRENSLPEEEGAGLKVFRNAVEYVEGNF